MLSSRKRTNYNYLHAQMMEALTLEKIKGNVEEYLANHAGPNLEDKLRNDFDDANIARAIRALGYAGEPITLWRWLCGGSLTAAELTSYNLTKNMDTVSEMYRVLVGIMRLFVNKGVYYLFLLDEMEGLTNIRNQDCRESFHDAFPTTRGTMTIVSSVSSYPFMQCRRRKSQTSCFGRILRLV